MASLSPALSPGPSREDLIKMYFFEGYEYRVIACFLYFKHGITLSVRQLKRLLRGMRLRRRVRPGADYCRVIASLLLVGNQYFLYVAMSV